MGRKRFTERQVIETLFHQGVTVWCFRCLEPITPHRHENGKVTVDAQREHLHEVALGGPDVPENCRYSHADCHDRVTNGTKATTAGSSKNRIAKANNDNRKVNFIVNKPPIDMMQALKDALAAEKPKPERKMKSRGFQEPPEGYKHRWGR